jgi:hypothetical protein
VVEPPHVQVQIARGAWVDPDAMVKQIKKAGFAAIRDDFQLTVTGVVTPAGNGFAVALDSMQVARSLPIAPGADSLAAHVGQPVQVAGVWRLKEKSLAVTTFTPLSALGVAAPAPEAAADTLYPAPRDSTR